MSDFQDDIERFNRKLQRLADNARKLDGQRGMFAELFPAEFMRRHTRVATFEALLGAGGVSDTDFAAIPDDKWDATVRAHTSFANWEEMKSAAAGEWAKRRMMEGL